MLLRRVVFVSFVLAFSIASASPEGTQLAGLVRDNQFLRLDGLIFETQHMKKLYEATGWEPLWIRGGRLTAQGRQLKATLQSAGRHGLDPNDYWSPTLAQLENDPQNWISFELIASDSFFKFARDLSVGRVDPDVVDDDIKFQRRPFDVNAAVAAASSGDLSGALDLMAPQIAPYQRLKAALANVRAAIAAKQAYAFKAVDKNLVPGSSHEVLGLMKRKLRLLGYAIGEFGPQYTAELGEAVKQFQFDHNLSVTTTLSPNSITVRTVGQSLEGRLRSIELSMEKLRWLPAVIESNYVFVNLAFQQFRLYEAGRPIMTMKTINGRGTRRTPVMRDAIRTVEFNPTWTVPQSIALKDKLSHIQQDVSYLEQHRLTVHDAETFRQLDPHDIDWDSLGKGNFPYYLRQMPGVDNALGVMKFHLGNPWAIYFHDTNERNLFKQNFRLLSSGCIRLERPLDLAVYLLRGFPQWNERTITPILSTGARDEKVPTEVRVNLPQTLPVYLMSLTAEVTDEGHLRFAEDHYGQDMRLARTLAAPAPSYAGADRRGGGGILDGFGFGGGEGALVVAGQPGPSQIGAKVFAIRCDEDRRAACDQPVVFDLNQPQRLRSGSYIVGFENTLMPGFVEIDSRRTTRIDLVKVAVPAKARGAGMVRVFRDLTNPVEQRKFAWAYYQLGRHPFGEAAYDFGDLYPAALNKRDVVGKIDESYCAQLPRIADVTEEAREICETYAQARTYEDTMALFKFGSDSSVTQQWVVPPGDRVQVKLRRHLVSGPIADTEFVSVLPGVYRAIGETQKSSTPFSAGRVQENYPSRGWRPGW